MSLRPSRVPGASPVTPKARIRCTICQRFTKTLVADGRCEPCTGVLPLDFTPRTAGELAKVCVKVGAHELDEGDELCACGQHALRVCVRCLEPDTTNCPSGVA